MRKRNHPDWPILVYKYWAEPVGNPPEELWRQAHAMKDLWNRLVSLRDSVLSDTKDVEDKEKKRERWKAFEDETLALIRSDDVRVQLGWEAREHILDRFRTASREAIKRGGTMKVSRRLERIVIPHRFTAGGMPVAELFLDRRGAVRLRPVDEQAYMDASRASVRRRITQGYFRVGDSMMPIRSILHRELPEKGLIKNVSFCGRFVRKRGWRWSLHITVEQPPFPQAAISGRVCGLDLGWRKFDAYMRVGLVADNAGQIFELRLPMLPQSKKQIKGGKPDSLDELLALDAKIGTMVEECKSELKVELERMGRKSPLPQEVRQSLAHFAMTRQSGLVRLGRLLKQFDESEGERRFDGALQIIEEWLDKNDRLQMTINNARERLQGRRRYIYEHIALWLVDNYDEIIWEETLDLKEMAVSKGRKRDGEKDPALDRARRYRQWASLSELRSIIKRTVGKAGRKTKDGGTAYSTTTCHVCGGHIEASAKLYVVCERGHRHDQDVNATKNFLAHGGAEIEVGEANPGTELELPFPLKNVIVPIND